MKSLVLDFIKSYENRISMVESLVTTAYQAKAASDESLAELDREREGLKTSLRETLVQNCSLRRKDFNNLMERILADSQGKKKEIEEEQRRVRENLKEYLDEQEGLAVSLKAQVAKFIQEKADKESLEAIITELAIMTEFRAVYQEKGEQVFALLRNFQWRLEVFQREQEEINHKLQKLVDRGESLKVEDMRQLEAVKARQARKAEKELRREDVERLLAHFRQERQRSSHHS